MELSDSGRLCQTRMFSGFTEPPVKLCGFEKCRIEDRPEMDDPPEQDKPEDCRQAKLDDRHQQSALKQLPQSGDEETAECGENVAR